MTLPVRSRIRSAIIYGLKQITVANGYYNNVLNVYSPERAVNAMPEFPAINVYIDTEQCDNSSNVQLNQNEAALHNSFMARMTCFMNDQNDPALAQDKILADIQKYFGTYYYIPDSNGEHTCFSCYYDSSDPFGLEINSPNCGIAVNYKVWYRQKLTDPTIRT